MGNSKASLNAKIPKKDVNKEVNHGPSSNKPHPVPVLVIPPTIGSPGRSGPYNPGRIIALATFPKAPIILFLFLKFTGLEGYMNGYKLQLRDRDNMVHYLKLVSGTWAFFKRCIEFTGEIKYETKTSGRAYPMSVIALWVNKDDNTPERRLEGMKALKQVFMDPTLNAYPATNLQLIDNHAKCNDNYEPFDKYLLPNDIKLVMQQTYPTETLDDTFQETHGDELSFFFSKPTSDPFAQSLGAPAPNENDS